MKKQRYLVVTAVLAGFVALSSFAYGNETDKHRAFENTPKEPAVIKPDIPAEYNDLIKVFDTYWDALKAKDFKRAYDLESSDYRKATDFGQYKGKFGKDVILKNVRALGVTKLNEREVMVRGTVLLNVNLGERNTNSFKILKDQWVKEDNGWKHVRREENQ